MSTFSDGVMISGMNDLNTTLQELIDLFKEQNEYLKDTRPEPIYKDDDDYIDSFTKLDGSIEGPRDMNGNLPCPKCPDAGNVCECGYGVRFATKGELAKEKVDENIEQCRKSHGNIVSVIYEDGFTVKYEYYNGALVMIDHSISE